MIKKTIIRSYLSIITLNVNGLTEPTNRQTDWADENKHRYALHLPHHSA